MVAVMSAVSHHCRLNPQHVGRLAAGDIVWLCDVLLMTLSLEGEPASLSIALCPSLSPSCSSFNWRYLLSCRQGEGIWDGGGVGGGGTRGPKGSKAPSCMQGTPARHGPPLPSLALRKQLVMNTVRKAAFESGLKCFPGFSESVFSSVKWK